MMGAEDGREERIRAELEGNLGLIKERLEALEVDPAKAPPITVLNFYETEIRLETGKLTGDLPPKDQLDLFDRAEKWYTDREASFPNLRWLDNQRAKVQEQLNLSQ